MDFDGDSGARSKRGQWNYYFRSNVLFFVEFPVPDFFAETIWNLTGVRGDEVVRVSLFSWEKFFYDNIYSEKRIELKSFRNSNHVILKSWLT